MRVGFRTFWVARNSHHLTAKSRDRCATTSLRSIVVLNGLSSTPARANRRPPRSDAPLTHFRSPRGENCGLAYCFTLLLSSSLGGVERGGTRAACAKLKVAFEASHFNKALGMKIVELHEDGATLRLPIRPEHSNGSGRTHGGVIATLADAAVGVAITKVLKRRGTTIEPKINYLNPATEGELSARSYVLRAGKRTLVLSCVS